MRHSPIISGAKVNVRSISGIEEDAKRARRRTQWGREHANGLRGIRVSVAIQARVRMDGRIFCEWEGGEGYVCGKRHAPDKLCACFPLEVHECLLRLFAPANC